MKIYPCKRSIRTTAKPTVADIPLAYINKDMYPQEIKIVKTDKFALSSEKDVLPFDVYLDDSILFFNSDGSAADNVLTKTDNGYTYYPDNVVEFSPELFTATAVVKKNLTYDSSKRYNINICVNETDNELTWSKQLISIFGDAPKRGICPSSISVNNMANQPISLINADYKSNDFLFVKTSNGKTLKGSESDLDVNTILGEHTNLWITVPDPEPKYEDANVLFKAVSVVPTYPILYNKLSGLNIDRDTINIEATDYINTITDTYSDDVYDFDYTYEMFGVIIAHKENYGYIVFSYESFLNNLSSNVGIIYDILMRVYLKSYLNVYTNKLFITNYQIDYKGNPNCLFKRTHETVNLDALLKNDNCDIDTYNLIAVITDNKSVVFKSFDSYHNLNFVKLSGTDDPVKPDDCVSLYTTKKTVVYYKNNPIKEIESDIVIDTSIDNEYNCYITVNPLKSSAYRINVTEPIRFKIPDINSTYYIVALSINNDEKSSVMFINTKDYIEEAGEVIALVSVIFNSDDSAYDVRVLGGGLPLNCDDNYEMLDIGNLKGRHYRVGVSGIIKLPERLREHESIILDAVNKHCCATEYYTIVYY